MLRYNLTNNVISFKLQLFVD